MPISVLLPGLLGVASSVFISHTLFVVNRLIRFECCQCEREFSRRHQDPHDKKCRKILIQNDWCLILHVRYEVCSQPLVLNVSSV